MQLWDHDSNPANRRKMGVCRFDLSNSSYSKRARAPHISTIKWIKLEDVHGNITEGGLLVSIQLIEKRDISDRLDPPEDLTPAMRLAYLEVTALGLRDMQRYEGKPVAEPELRFDIPNMEDGIVFMTGRKKAVQGSYGKNSGASDTNFLYKTVIPITIPENAKFAPSLMMRVTDRRLVSLNMYPLVGSSSISLQQFLPWNGDGYKAPQSQLFDPFDIDSEDFTKAPKDEDEDAGVHDELYFFDEPEYISEDELILEEEKEKSKWMKDVRKEEAERKKNEMKSDEDDAEDANAPEGGDDGVGAFAMTATEDIFFPDIVSDGADPLELLEAGKSRPLGTDGTSWVLDPKAEAKKLAEERLKEMKGEELDADELGIVFPQTWADAKYRVGRDWWIEQDGKELEQYLENMPFENYGLYLGRYHPNKEKSTRRMVGIMKGMIRVTEEDPREEPSQFIDMSVVKQEGNSDYKVRIYVVKGQNLQPVGGGLSDPYLKLKLGNTEIRDLDSKQESTTEPNFFRSYEIDARIPGQSMLQIELRDHQPHFWQKHQLIGQTTIDLEDRWFHRKWQALGRNRQAPGFLADYDGFRQQLKPLELRNLTLPGSELAQGQIEMWLEICPKKEASYVKMVELASPPEKKFELRIVCWRAEDVPKRLGKDIYVDFGLALPEAGKKKSTDIHFRCKDGRPAWNYRIKLPVTLPLKDPLHAQLSIQLWDFDVLTSNTLIGERNFDLYGWFMMAYHREAEIQPFKIMHQAKEAQALERGGNPEHSAAAERAGSDEQKKSQSLGEKDRLPLLGQADYATATVDVIDGDVNDFSIDGNSVVVAEEEALLGQDSADSEDDETDDDDEVQDDKAQAEEAYNNILSLIGMGKIAEDAMWMNMTSYDTKRKKLRRRGRLAFSIQIVPEEEVEARPAGSGRSEPNANPYLPPPPGRLSFTFNPLSMLMVLFPPEILACICCCICILFLAAVMLYGGSYYVTYVTLVNNIRK